MATTEDREQDAWSQIGALLKLMHDRGWFPGLTIRCGGETAFVELRVDPFGCGEPDVCEWRIPFSGLAQGILAKLEGLKQKVNTQWDNKKI